MKLPYILIIALGLLSMPSFSKAQTIEGARDSSFVLRMSGGVQFSPVGPNTDTQANAAISAVELEDGKMVILYQDALSFFNADGTHDESIAPVILANQLSGRINPRVLLKTADDKLLLIGSSRSQFSSTDFIAAKFNLDGSLDTSFGENGFRFIDYNNENQYSYMVSLGADESIYIAGSTGVSPNNGIILKLTKNGLVDTNFGANGFVKMDFGSQYQGEATVIKATVEGVFIGGYIKNAVGTEQFYVAKYSHDGVLDTSFGTDGNKMFSYGFPKERIVGITELPSGDVVGLSNYSGVQLRVFKLNTAGEVDNTFGTNGFTLISGSAVGGGILAAELFLSEEKELIVAGTKNIPSIGTSLYILKLDTTGVLNPTFGVNGILGVDYSKVTESYISLFETEDNTFTIIGRSESIYGHRLTRNRLFKNGERDNDFNVIYTYGEITHDYGGEDIGKVVRVKDNKIYVAAQTSNSLKVDDFVIRRYTMDGEIDSTFNGTGKVMIDMGKYTYRELTEMDFDSDGKIVLIGIKYVDSLRKLYIVRRNADGSKDESYGNGNGYVTQTIFTGTNIASQYIGAAQIYDDKIYLASAETIQNGKSKWTLARLYSNGLYDGSFGTSGKIDIPLGNPLADRLLSLLIQPDGKAVVAGSTASVGTMYRILANGTIDSTFADAGKLQVHINNYASEYSRIKFLPDYNIIVAGKLSSTFSTAFLTRVTPDGKIDTKYGVGGMSYIHDFEKHNEISSLEVLSDKSVLVFASNGKKNEESILLTRISENGTIDASFGDSGKIFHKMRGTASTIPYGAFVQQDGKLLVTGAVATGNNTDFFLSRYNQSLSNAPALESLINKDFQINIQQDGSVTVAGEVYPGPNTINDITLWFGTDYDNLTQSVKSTSLPNNTTGYEWKPFTVIIPEMIETDLVVHAKLVLRTTNGLESSARTHIYENKILPKAGLTAWYAPTNNVLKNQSGTIRSVLDLSDQRNNLLTESETSAPVFNQNGINNRPNFTFDGTEKYFITEKDLDITKGTTVFIVGTNNVIKNSNGLLRIAEKQTGFSNFELYWDYGEFGSGTLAFAANQRSGLVDGRGIVMKNVGPAVGEPYLMTINVDSVLKQTSFVNGSIARVTSTLGTSHSGGYTPTKKSKAYIGLGKFQNVNYSSYLDGEISEMIIYNHVLNEEQRDSVQAYLNEKYFVEYVSNEPTEVLEKLTFNLAQNYPNPFNPSTHIAYTLENPGMVRLNVYNVMGQLVSTLVEERKQSGHHNVRWNAGNIASGVYYYRLESNNKVFTKKMTLIK